MRNYRASKHGLDFQVLGQKVALFREHLCIKISKKVKVSSINWFHKNIELYSSNAESTHRYMENL